ncbi:MAG: hypothetical protein JRG92_06440 [Deltaproteobacteria bacterium]|nr:hypothetical protein [Deltaproteobacteria bacterium]MBW2383252.1 hypothetical protein [Deltaproteobacteria bacterium]MBW2694986.1 hypothetical protein [Deltaproteobacteria bacterium]
MAEIFTGSVEHSVPRRPEWLKRGSQRPLALLLVVASAALIWSIGPRVDDGIAHAAVVEIETTQQVDLPREWRWSRQAASFDSMHGTLR